MPPQLTRRDQPGDALIERIAQRPVFFADVDARNTHATRGGPTSSRPGNRSLIEAGRGQVLQGRVVLAVLNGRHGVGRPIESDDVDVLTPLLGREGIGRRARPSTPTVQRPPPGFGCFRSAHDRIGLPRRAISCSW